ncbi:MAG: metallophosphoesterase family protein [Candidatus Fimenecus sp.]
MKKTVSILTVFFMVLFLFSSCVFSADSTGDISGYAQMHSIIDRAIPAFSVNENGDFTVLQFSDTHLISGNTKKDRKTLENLRAQIERVRPDLVVISGDMIEGSNQNPKYNKKAALETVGALFEDLAQYWAYVPGNNDGEMFGTSEDVASFLAQYAHCVLADADSLTGATQYVIDLKDDTGSVVHSLIFMDSLARDANNQYDYMKADQVAWARQILSARKAENPEAKCSFFFHMNTPNFALSGKNGMPYSANYNPVPTDFYEGIDGNAAFDAMLADMGNVGLVSIGHIHPDTNYCSFLNGTYYHVVRAAGENATKYPGCVRITIHTAAQTTDEMYDFEEIVFKS